MKYLFALTFVLLAACDNSSNDDDKMLVCPKALPQISYTVAIHLPNDLNPDAVLVKENGVVILDECAEPSDRPPMVSIERAVGELEIKVNYYYSKNEPSSVSLEIIDQFSCGGGSNSFFTTPDSKLDYKKSYPYGKRCGIAFESAKLSFTKKININST